ncbi:MAG: PDZ domain-containing protein [Verrucomicrobiota bacterium]|nr:PDZ domain-containing protein [Verrucomicrobiota bacterium]MED5458044.1 PDZ domain-containing protein [Verrucomicrobiota bacterium]MEE2723854.1 PDZ domain-containing protein [Verrucomicrobiota bacterium]
MPQVLLGSIEELKERERKVKKVVSELMPTVVAVVGNDQPATGSGVIINEDGLIMTAGHVTEAAGKELTIIFPDGRSVKGESLGANRTRDAGLARITEEGKWPFAKIGDSKKAKLGEWLIAMGHPGGYDLNRSPPIRLGRLISSGSMGMLRTDCTLVGGDSGGPLFNLEGEVIGIHSSIGGSLAENRHVPSSVFKAGWDRMLAGEIWGSLGMMAAGVNPDRPMLGVRMNDSNGQVTVDKVFPNSPAKRAGIEDGDVILKIDGIAAEQMSDVVDQVSSSSAGDVLEVQIMRDDKEQSFKVKLVSWEDLASGLGNEEEPKLSQDTEKARPQLGVILDAEFAGRGAKIYEVINGSIASMAGILSGDIVKSVDGAEIFDANEMASKIKSAPLGSKIKFSIQRGNQDQLVEAEILFK